MTHDSRATGAPTDLVGGMPATETSAAATAPSVDPVDGLGADARRLLATVADHLIPAAHGMPSAAEIVTDDRLRFVLRARPDLLEPLATALGSDLGDDVATRLATLEAKEPAALAALQLTIVAGYYTDGRIRELIGYPGQLAIPVDGDEPLLHVEARLIDNLRARGPVWRDPRTGARATADADTPTPRTDHAAPFGREGGTHGRDGT